jgi:alanine dehydrogenase
VTLHLSEADVARLLTPAEAVATIEACFERMARGAVHNVPRYRVPLQQGAMAVMSAADLELGHAGAKVYVGFAEGARFQVLLFRADRPELVAVIEADKLGQLRTGAASGVAAKHLAKQGARTLGVIGCGWQAETQVACIRERFDCEPGETNSDAGECDIVVTVTGSRDPVLRGDWLKPGALVCAVGANDGKRREIDNLVLERAAFVCCDSVEDARLESADLIEPVAAGALDWLEVYELQQVVAGEVPGRGSDDDVVVFKSNGLAAWDVAAAAAVLAALE